MFLLISQITDLRVLKSLKEPICTNLNLEIAFKITLTHNSKMYYQYPYLETHPRRLK